MRRPLLAAALAATAALAAACGSTAVATPLAAAPEPAVSPAPTAAPTGTVYPLAGAPEGIAVDAAGTAAVNVHDPDGVVIFPAASPTQRVAIPLDGSARHLLLAGPDGPLIVPQESADTVVELALPSGAEVASIPVGRVPHDAIAVGTDEIFAADEAADTIDVIRDGVVVRTVASPLEPGGMAEAPGGSVVVVVGVRGRRITAYRPDGDALGSANCGAGPTHAVTGSEGVFWVVDTLGGAVLGFEVRDGTPVQVARIPIGPRPYGVAYDTARDILWVTVTGSDRLVGLHLDGDRVLRRVDLATVRQPNTVAVDPVSGATLVTGSTAAGSIEVIGLPTGL